MPWNVTSVGEIRKNARQLGMPDWLSGRVRLEITLGHVGLVLGIVHKNPVPGAILWRPRSGDPRVPLLGALKARIGVDDDTAIVEKPMADRLADGEPCSSTAHATRNALVIGDARRYLAVNPRESEALRIRQPSRQQDSQRFTIMVNQHQREQHGQILDGETEHPAGQRIAVATKQLDRLPDEACIEKHGSD